MVLTPTIHIPLGYEAPAFQLPDTLSGNRYSYADLRGEKGTLVMFICNHCPYVIHNREELIKLANDYKQKGIELIAISSNDAVNYPDDGPDKMKALAEEENFPFPYLYDESQEVAKAYDAACTPDFNLFDANDKCVYRGRLDSSRPGKDIPVTGEDMRSAFDSVLIEEEIAVRQFPSLGCNIKWKS